METAEIETRICQLEETLSERLTKLEEQVTHLARQVNMAPTSSEGTAWWKKIVGVHKNDPEFDEAMRLGREYRELLRLEEERTAEGSA